MREIKMKVYTFSELGDCAREKAVADAWHWLDNDHTDEVREEFDHLLHEAGLPREDVRFRLNHCQGDGVAFYDAMDPEHFFSQHPQWRAEHKRLFDDNGDFMFNIEIMKSESFHMYDHHNTMYLHIDSHQGHFDHLSKIADQFGSIEEANAESAIDTALEEFEIFLITYIRDISRKLESVGYDIVDGYQSDEYIVDTLNINDYEFLEDGSLYN